jgi:hypothetical protein
MIALDELLTLNIFVSCFASNQLSAVLIEYGENQTMVVLKRLVHVDKFLNDVEAGVKTSLSLGWYVSS